MMPTTAYEADKDGKIIRVFHRYYSEAWTHKPGDPCKVCDKEKKK